jgi:CRISPR/Cas system CMR-associated protein Cmr1 (group 7 of RAMP superfamily)
MKIIKRNLSGIKKLKESYDTLHEWHAFVDDVLKDIMKIIREHFDMDENKANAIKVDLVQWYKRNLDKIYRAVKHDYEVPAIHD